MFLVLLKGLKKKQISYKLANKKSITDTPKKFQNSWKQVEASQGKWKA